MKFTHQMFAILDKTTGMVMTTGHGTPAVPYIDPDPEHMPAMHPQVALYKTKGQADGVIRLFGRDRAAIMKVVPVEVTIDLSGVHGGGE